MASNESANTFIEVKGGIIRNIYFSIVFRACRTQAQIDSAKKFFDAVNQRINDEVYSRVKFDKKIIKRLKTDDVFMNEEEALSYGVIDKVVDNFEELM